MSEVGVTGSNDPERRNVNPGVPREISGRGRAGRPSGFATSHADPLRRQPVLPSEVIRAPLSSSSARRERFEPEDAREVSGTTTRPPELRPDFRRPRHSIQPVIDTRGVERHSPARLPTRSRSRVRTPSARSIGGSTDNQKVALSSSHASRRFSDESDNDDERERDEDERRNPQPSDRPLSCPPESRGLGTINHATTIAATVAGQAAGQGINHATDASASVNPTKPLIRYPTFELGRRASS